MSDTKGYIPFLDGIRGIAILAVFLFHGLSPSFGFNSLEWDGLFRSFEAPMSFFALYPMSYGYAGVAIFFVVSGFCIHASYQRTKSSGWLYFASRRIFRIFPAYLIAVCLFFFVWPWGSFDFNEPDRFTQLWTHLLAVHNLFPSHVFFGINASFWSIGVEAQLYLIYPLLVLLTQRIGWRRGIVVVGLIEMGLCTAKMLGGLWGLDLLPNFFGGSPFDFWFSWSIGAYLWECSREGRTSRLFEIRFDLLLILCLLLPFCQLTQFYYFPAFSLLAGVAIDRLMRKKWTIPENALIGLIWSHLSFLGMVSFSFYLFHQPFMNLVDNLLSAVFRSAELPPLAIYAACCSSYPFILALSYLMYKCLEQPSIRIGSRFWKRMQAE